MLKSSVSSSEPRLQPRVALVYDWVDTPHGGAEQVLLLLHELFPSAPLFTSLAVSWRAPWASVFTVKTSFLQRVPGAKIWRRACAPLMPLAFETLDLRGYDIVISVSSAEAKGVLTTPDQLHLCYLLTPTRYLWSHHDVYARHAWLGWLRRGVFRYLRWWDTVAAWRPDDLIVISQRVAERCVQYYHRAPVKVVYPPVRVHWLQAQEAQSAAVTLPSDVTELISRVPSYLVVARLVDYKRVDLAIKACARLGRGLIVVGDGPAKQALRVLATREKADDLVVFVSTVQSAELIAYYRACTALLMPGEEDFGIAVMEAQAVGKPVVVHRKSGAAEFVKDGVTGIHLPAEDLDSLVAAIRQLEATTWSARKIQTQARLADEAVFMEQFRQIVAQRWSAHQSRLRNEQIH